MAFVEGKLQPKMLGSLKIITANNLTQVIPKQYR